MAQSHFVEPPVCMFKIDKRRCWEQVEYRSWTAVVNEAMHEMGKVPVVQGTEGLIRSSNLVLRQAIEDLWKQLGDDREQASKQQHRQWGAIRRVGHLMALFVRHEQELDQKIRDYLEWSARESIERIRLSELSIDG